MNHFPASKNALHFVVGVALALFLLICFSMPTSALSATQDFGPGGSHSISHSISLSSISLSSTGPIKTRQSSVSSSKVNPNSANQSNIRASNVRTNITNPALPSMPPLSQNALLECSPTLPGLTVAACMSIPSGPAHTDRAAHQLIPKFFAEKRSSIAGTR